MPLKEEFRAVKKRVKNLERNISELDKTVKKAMERLKDPRRAYLESLGIESEKVLTKEGLGVGYIEALERIARKRGEGWKEEAEREGTGGEEKT